MFLSKAKGRSLVGWGLRPYEYPGATSTSLECALRRSCARPTGGTHGRTTGTPILLISIRFPLKNKEGRDTPKDTPARLPTLRVATTTRHGNVLDFLVAVRQLENVPEEVPAVVAQASFWLAL